MKIRFEATKNHHIPISRECGGGHTNTGDAIIIASPDGEPKKALYIRSGGHLANAHHALIPIQVGDKVIKLFRSRSDLEITILEVTSISENGPQFLKVGTFNGYEWDNPLIAEKFKEAIASAFLNSRCYHCREPHYVRS